MDMRETAKTYRMIEILNDTYKFYMENPDKRGFNTSNSFSGGQCAYLTPDGNKCAVGRCMIDPTERMVGNVWGIGDGHKRFGKLDSLLKKKYRGLPLQFWQTLQNWHDHTSRWTLYQRTGDSSVLYTEYLKIHGALARGSLFDGKGPDD